MPPHGLTDRQKQEIFDLRYSSTLKDAEIAQKLGVGRSSVMKYGKGARADDPNRFNPRSRIAAPTPSSLPPHPRTLPGGGRQPSCPEPSPEAGGASLPNPIDQEFVPFRLDGVRRIGLLQDAHIPHHDRRTVERFVADCRARAVDCVVLNGDILDFHELSVHARDPDAVRFVDEVDKGEQFVRWLRSCLPDARILWVEGNHEDRFPRWLMQNAKELQGIKGIDVPGVLNLAGHGVEWVGEQRAVLAGDWTIIHGHQYKGGGQKPAKAVLDKARVNIVTGHWHRADSHHHKDYGDAITRCFTFGCACFLAPRWLRKNQWVHGYGMMEISGGRGVVESILMDGTGRNSEGKIV